MDNRANGIRKRIAKRKREKQPIHSPRRKENTYFLPKDEERYGSGPFPSYEGSTGEGRHPLFRKEVFIFKVLLSVILVLCIAIIFRNQSSQLENVRHFVSSTMENDFQFATVTAWYEEQFGSPLALLPTNNSKDNNTNVANADEYVVPANGTVLESFGVNGQGIMVETDSKVVGAMNEGTVLEVATKGDLGRTIVIQHRDGSETWYGNLKPIDVKLFDYVETGQELGQVMDEGENKGTFYFAIKQGETFIDPIQVIKFE